MAETAAGKELEARAQARQAAKAKPPQMQIEITVSEVTVDDLHEQLSKLRDIGWGKAPIEWHTSRSHLGKSITLSLGLERDDM